MKHILTLSTITTAAALSSLFAQSPTLTHVEKIKAPDPEVVITNHTNQLTVSGTRDAYFIHGLGGSPQSWNETASRLEADFELIYHIPEYNNAVNGNMVLAAQECHRWVNNNQNNLVGIPSMAIAITHSQGGLVGKAMENESIRLTAPIYNRKFGGLVTFGTPHQGAMILNNSDPNGNIKMLEAFVNDGCIKLGKPAVASLVSSSWALRTFSRASSFRSTLFETIPSALCGTFAGTALPLFLDDLATDLTADYNVGSPMVNTLNTMNTNIPVVTFYGIEQQPVFFKTISSFTMDSRPITTSDPYSGGDDDTEYEQTAINMMNQYLSTSVMYHNRAIKHRTRARRYFALSSAFPPFAALGYLALQDAQRADEYKGYNIDAFGWLHGANDNWLDIIGAKEERLMNVPNPNNCRTTFRVSSGYTAIPLKDENGQLMTANINYITPCPSQTVNNVELRRIGIFNQQYTQLVRLMVQAKIPLSQGGYNWVTLSGSLDPTLDYLFNGNGPSIQGFMIHQPVPNIQLVTIVNPSDGVVTAASQKGYPNAVAKVKMPNTNHQQMRNSTETKRAFDNLFGGAIRNTDFFETDRK